MSNVRFNVSSAYAYIEEDWAMFGPVYIRDSESNYQTFSPDELEEAKYYFEDARHLGFNDRKMLGLVHAISERLSNGRGSIMPGYGGISYDRNVITNIDVDLGNLKDSPFNSNHTFITPGYTKRNGREITPTWGLEGIVTDCDIIFDRRAVDTGKGKRKNVFSSLKLQALVDR